MQLDDMAVVKKRRKKRVKDPTRPKHLPFVYVIYAWSSRYNRWYLLAFVRQQSDRLNSKRITKLRAKFHLPDHVQLRFRELFVAAANPDHDLGDPTIDYHLRRHADRRRYAPDVEASFTHNPRPRPFPKRRPVEPSHDRSNNGSDKRNHEVN